MKSKKLLSLLLAVVMCFITTVPAWADSRAISSDVTAVSMESIDAMTNAQRNAFISQCAAQELERSSSSRDIALSPEILRLCWYAAAKIAESKYPCAAKLVEYAARGIDYVETEGRFSTKIRQSADYREWRTTHSEDKMEFSSGDLFYALHGVDISIVSQTSGGARVCITDTFDFKFETDLGSVILTLINDGAWLSQKIYALSVIQVDICFIDPAL